LELEEGGRSTCMLEQDKRFFFLTKKNLFLGDVVD
jgi:hypothetical protein